MFKKHLHKILFSLFFLVIAIPVVIYKFDIADRFKLEGAYTTIAKPEFTFGKYFNEKFQSEYDKYWNSEFGFRGFFVRLHNQLLFSVFNKSMVYGVEVGKDNYLYETQYIDAFYGKDFIGEPSIDDRCNKLKIISDSLSKHGCEVLVVLTPGKGSFYPEYISDYHKHSGNPTNYETYVNYFKKYGIDFVDYNSWLISLKQTSKYPLFPKTGIHWSYYGMTLVADSLIKYIEKKLNKDIPEMIIDSIEVKKECENTDDDIENAMNLHFPIKKPLMAYSRFHFNSENKFKPRTLVISDSFYWSFYDSGISNGIFRNNRFMYYYKEVYPEHFSQATYASDINIKDELDSTDLIIIMTNEPNLNNLGFGFIDEILTMFNSYDVYLKNKRINEIKSEMIKSPEWMEVLYKKAYDKKMTIEEVMEMDAVWMYENETK